jgi:hypothetical protein
MTKIKALATIATCILSFNNSYSDPAQEPAPKNKSGFQIFLCWAFGSDTPEELPARQTITIDDHLRQLRYDINGSIPTIPSSEMAEIEQIIRQELRSCNITDQDLVNQIIRAALVEQSGKSAHDYLCTLQMRGYNISAQSRDEYVEREKNNLAGLLTSTRQLKGKTIYPYFGTTQQQRIREYFATYKRPY